MPTTHWITDRLPTIDDGDYDGDVIVASMSYRDTWYVVDYADVLPNQPWIAYTPPPSKQPLSESAEESALVQIDTPLANEIRSIICDELSRQLRPGGLLSPHATTQPSAHATTQSSQDS
jgi:hypothetical protein